VQEATNLFAPFPDISTRHMRQRPCPEKAG